MVVIEFMYSRGEHALTLNTAIELVKVFALARRFEMDDLCVLLYHEFEIIVNGWTKDAYTFGTRTLVDMIQIIYNMISGGRQQRPAQGTGELCSFTGHLPPRMASYDS